MHVEITMESRVGNGTLGEYVNTLFERGALSVIITLSPEYEELLRKKREVADGRQDSP